MRRIIGGGAVAWALFGAVACTAQVGTQKQTGVGVGQAASPGVGPGAGNGLNGSGGAGSTVGAGAGAAVGAGATVGAGAASSGGAVIDPGAPGITVIRRLNKTEYNNTVRDLIGNSSGPAKDFPPEEQGYGFNNNSAALTVSPVLVQAQLTAAEAMSAFAVSNLSTSLPCAAVGDDACAQQFIASFGERAFRHPLEATDTDRLTALFNKGKLAGGFSSGIEWVVQSVLLSPRFLYRVELSSASLDSWEVASRLSYLLWQSMPDSGLLDAARADSLVTPAGVTTQVDRLLTHENAKPALRDFHAQWLKYGGVQSLARDATAYPDFTPSIAQAMREELDELVTYAAFDSPSHVQTLLFGSDSFLNGPLATFYGVSGPTGASFSKVALNSAQRSGILTRGGLMAALSHPDQTSPVLRGKFVRTQLLCEDVPPPPPSVVTTLPPVTPTFTARDRMVQHTQDPTCNACHQRLDPIGFGFENLDPVGRWRDSDGGKPVDATGNISGTDTSGAFNGPAELAARLAASSQVNTCVATQYFRFATGRKEIGGDATTISQLSATLKDKGGSLTQLIAALAASNVLRNR